MRAYTCVFLLLCLLSAGVCQQSVTGATLSGEVHDPTGALVAEAAVSATDQETGREWRAVTSAQGHYRFNYLPSGNYLLKTESRGFTNVPVRVHLLVGQAFQIPLSLTLHRAISKVDVEATTPIVETVRTQLSASVVPAEIQHLPLNGRNYLDLALLVPGVSRTNTGANQRFAETSAVPGTGISVSSQRNLNNSFLVDGLSANDDAADLAGSYYSQEVIRDFQVVTSGIAEFGRASSGTINIETQAGSNTIYGGAYGFLRNQRFDAGNPLSGTKLPLTQAQYGVTAGGPIVKNKTFYFANFEQTRQQTAGVVTIADNATEAINTRLADVNYPGSSITSEAYSASLDTTNVFARVDQRWSNVVQSTFRYNFYAVESPNSRNVGGLNALTRAAGLEDHDHNFASSTVWTLSPRTLFEGRAQYMHSHLSAPVNDLNGPAVNISGVANFGTATFSPTARDIDMWQAVGTVSQQRGNHSMKAGVDYLHNLVKIDFPGALQGVYSFSSLSNFLAGNYLNFQQAFGPPITDQNNPNVAGFIEDEWKVTRNLTLNGGLRYEAQIFSDLVTTDTNNLSPRIGIAWDPWADGKTVVRANYGLFFDRIPLRAVSNAIQRDGTSYRLALLTPTAPGAPVFPSVLSAFPEGLLTNITTIDPAIASGRAQQVSLQIERSVGSSMNASIGYQHLRGERLILSRNVNVPTTTDPNVFNLGRPNPNYANNSQYQAIGDSWYNALMVSLNKRAGRLATFRFSYTFSKGLDDTGNFFFSSPQDNFDVLADKGRSDNDQRHRMSVSGTFLSPVTDSSGLLRKVSKNWQLSYIFSYTSALPFNVLMGNDRNGDTNANDRPVGVGRNTGEGFDFQSLDIRVARVFPISERFRVEATADLFNVLNHRNNMVPNNIFGTGVAPRPSFGQPTAVGDPRQVQLGLRLSF